MDEEMKKHKCSITYEIITEESAQEGDVAEHGWWMPGYCEYPLRDANGQHDETLADANNGVFNLDLRTAITNAMDLGCTEMNICDNRLSIRSVDAAADREYFEEGESRYYTLHIEGVSKGTVDRVVELFR